MKTNNILKLKEFSIKKLLKCAVGWSGKDMGKLSKEIIKLRTKTK